MGKCTFYIHELVRRKWKKHFVRSVVVFVSDTIESNVPKVTSGDWGNILRGEKCNGTTEMQKHSSGLYFTPQAHLGLNLYLCKGALFHWTNALNTAFRRRSGYCIHSLIVMKVGFVYTHIIIACIVTLVNYICFILLSLSPSLVSFVRPCVSCFFDLHQISWQMQLNVTHQCGNWVVAKICRSK